jgi:hypothetical protein
VEAEHFLLATHWITYFGHIHGRVPAPTRAKDHDALRNILNVQAFGHEDRAYDMLEEIIRAPVPGDSLRARYVAYLHWIESRKPRTYRAPSRYIAQELRACIRGAA